MAGTGINGGNKGKSPEEQEKAKSEHEQRCKEEADRIWKTIEGTVNK